MPITTLRKAQEKEARRASILEATERLYITKGYDHVTMENVAEEAMLAKGTLYLYFDTKERLYVAVVERGAGILADLVEKAMAGEKKGLSKAYAAGLAYYEFSKRYPCQFDMYLDAQQRCFSPRTDEAVKNDFARIRNRLWKYSLEAVRTGIADGTIRPDLDPHKGAIFLMETTTSMIRASLEAHQIRGIPSTTRDEIVYFTLDMLKHALENKGGQILNI